jgi:hypothetical protein
MNFPTMSEKEYHASQLPLWEREHTSLSVKYRDAARREGARQDAVKLAYQIANLRYTIRNLKNLALGMQPGEVKSSINYAPEDFVSSGGQLRRVVV